MVDHQSDESLYRLQASDPATGTHPDLDRVRQLVSHKAPASRSTGAPGAARTAEDDLLRGPRLRAPWVAAAAIVALGIGAGGYALGVSRDDGTTLLANQASLLAPAAGGAGAGLSSAVSSLDLGSSVGSSSAPRPYDPGPVRLVAADSLSTQRTTGQVRALMTDETAQAYLERWTDAMNLSGHDVGGTELLGDVVGTYDQATGEMATVSDEHGGLSFSYTSLFRSEGCTEMRAYLTRTELETMTEQWREAFGPDVPVPSPADCLPPNGERPSDEEAVAQAREFLTDAGVPVEDYVLRVPRYEDRTSLFVTVEGWPEGSAYGPLHVYLRIGPDGVVDASGSIGEMTSLGDYPVISPAEAVERYGTREYSTEYGVSLPEDYEELEQDPDATVTFIEPEIEEAPELEEGMSIPLLLKDKEVTGAELVQGMVWTQAGSLEVPTWKLTTDDGMSYPVMAVADEAILFQTWELPR